MLTLFTMSCEDRLPVGVQVASKPCMLDISSNTLSYNYNDTVARTLKVSSENVAWEIKDVPSWLTVTPTSGNSNANVKVKPSANNVVEESRVAVLKFVSTSPEYQYSRTITVSQNAPWGYIELGESSWSCSASSATKVIAVDSNIEWEVSCSDSWVSAVKKDETSVAITVTENLGETRTAYVSLLRKSNSEPYASIYIKQAEAGISIGTDQLDFTVDGGTLYVDINAETSWSAYTSETSWLQVTPETCSAGEHKLEVQALPSNSTKERLGYVYVKIGDIEKFALAVVQEGVSLQVASLNNQSNVFDWKGEKKLSYKVISNTSWELQAKPDWITVTPESGNSGTAIVTVSADESNSLNSRSGKVRIGVGNLDVYKEFVVEQNGIDLSADGALSFGWEAAEKEYKVVLPNSWNSMKNSDWITLSQTSGNGGETIVVSVLANDNEEARNGIVYFMSEGHTFEVLVVQDGQYIRISSASGEIAAMGGSVSLELSTTVGARDSVDYKSDVTGWLNVDKDENNIYTLSAGYNPSMNDRLADFIIMPTASTTNSSCTSGVKFNVVQKGRNILVSTDKIEVYNNGGYSETYSITADGGYTIEKAEGDDWYLLQHNDTARTFSIVVTPNVSEETKRSKITISLTDLPEGETKTVEIEVIQYSKRLINGHETIDLGLPSGLLWATCNMGASSPEEYGGYYAWGETYEKEGYTADGCSTYGVELGDISGNPEYDVARALWGSEWRVPTFNDLQELLDNCTWTQTVRNGVNGYLVTGRNGNSIFLPASGYRNGTSLAGGGSGGNYWSSEPHPNGDASVACCLYLNGSERSLDMGLRYLGLSIRPVISSSAVDDHFSLETTELQIPSSAGVYSIAVNTSVEWTAEVDAEWISLASGVSVDTMEEWTSTNKGHGTTSQKEYVLNVEAGDTLSFNWSVSSESGCDILTITLDGTQIVRQSGTASDSYTHVFTSSGTHTLLAVYSKDGSVSNGSDEGRVYDITLKRRYNLQGSEDGSVLAFAVSEHMEYGPRTATITFRRNRTREVLETLTVTQDGLHDYFFLSVETFEASSSASEYTVECNTDMEWIAESSADWLTFEQGEGNLLRILVADNWGESREATITFRHASSGEVLAELLVHQVNFILNFSMSAGEANFAAYSSSTDIAVETNVPWSASTTDDWMTLEYTDSTLTITVTENEASEARAGMVTLVNTLDGSELSTVTVFQARSLLREAVDLGLPSGLQWATCNVGAYSVGEYGNFYAWGEIATKGNYNSNTSTTNGVVLGDITGNEAYDAARANWSDEWRMPTNEEFDELIRKCVWEWTSENGMDGYRVTGPNGNSIFLPASGRNEGYYHYYGGTDAYYWCSTPNTGNTSMAYAFYYSSNSTKFVNPDISRGYGNPIRPVKGEVNKKNFTLEPTSIDADRCGDYIIKVNTNIDWTAESSEGWAVITKIDDSTLKVTLGYNVLTERTAEITFMNSSDNSELAVVTVTQASEEFGTTDGYDYVDLGLPSGTKWAICNMGASAFYDRGDHYAWGELETKSYYGEDNSRTYGLKLGDFSGYVTYDAARANWGGKWRVPTKEEFDELVNGCTWVWSPQQGVGGYIVTGPNGNSIFMPDTGCNGSIDEETPVGYYWSSTPDDWYHANCLILGTGVHIMEFGRYNGCSIRPVFDDEADKDVDVDVDGYDKDQNWD